jgi:hypothetical protein
MRIVAKSLLLAGVVLMTVFARAQALLPEELNQGTPRILQQRYFTQLKDLGTELREHHFPYAFYFSRAMDISEAQQQKMDQRSLRFEKYNGQTMLVVTGNYYAAYSTELMDKNARTKRTLEDVVLPMLRIEAPYFQRDNDSFAGFAFEVSHHIRKKVVGISSENPENVVYVFPRAAANELLGARNEEQMQAAILDSQVFVDAEPFNLWVNGAKPNEEEFYRRREQRAATVTQPAEPAPNLWNPTQAKPARLLTPTDLANLKMTHLDDVDKLLGALHDQAHFVSYAQPEFVGFHEGAYLQLPVQTDLDVSGDPSRYKLAALAFDEHISHLVRPVLIYFEKATDFDGVLFSSTIKQKGKESALAVEYFFQLSPMRCYAQFDCTGQQLIDSGYVLINGERSTLNLMQAEAEDHRK